MEHKQRRNDGKSKRTGLWHRMGTVYRQFLAARCIYQVGVAMNTSPLANIGGRTAGETALAQIAELYEQGLLTEEEAVRAYGRLSLRLNATLLKVLSKGEWQ